MSRLIVSVRPTGVRYGPGARGGKGKVRRKRISAAKRRIVLERDGHRCVRCGSARDLTMDHDIPVAKGGSNDADNLVTMCRACNEWKGDRFV